MTRLTFLWTLLVIPLGLGRALAATSCPVCKKTVKPVESVSFQGEVYHKRCVKCATCGIQLNLKTVRKRQGQLYCPVHVREP